MRKEPFGHAQNGGASGDDLHGFVRDLHPICRSITGDGVRETLRLIGERVPFDMHEVPSGTEALDCTVPPEWNIQDAWVRNEAGEKVFRHSGTGFEVRDFEPWGYDERQYCEVFRVLEWNARYRSRSPFGEPQLGRRGLDGEAALEGEEAERARQALPWVLNLSDGAHSLLDVAARAGLPFRSVREAADRLEAGELLEPIFPDRE
jgi:aminopeptidase-like protein